MYILVFATNVVFGQETIESYDSEAFALRVKQIDEFIERFNNVDSTLIKKYLKERYDLEVTRKDLVLSLFSFSERQWDKQQIAEFLEDVVYANKPLYLSFYDQDWYAKVLCLANYQGKPTSFDLILSIKTDHEKQSVNWNIRSLKAEFMGICENFDFNTLLSPNGHGTNFLEFRRIFSNPQQYADTTQSDKNPMNQLLKLAESGELQFKGVDKVSYHFLQLDHWIMRIEEFEGREKINGWLISEIIHSDVVTKERYLHDHLHIIH